tara:strand:+ start:247 stop:354 length:108 start_codon:yes stop_codon:yes gene_type:complete
MGLRFEEINPPKKEGSPAPAAKKETKKAKSSKVEE